MLHFEHLLDNHLVYRHLVYIHQLFAGPLYIHLVDDHLFYSPLSYRHRLFDALIHHLGVAAQAALTQADAARKQALLVSAAVSRSCAATWSTSPTAHEDAASAIT